MQHRYEPIFNGAIACCCCKLSGSALLRGASLRTFQYGDLYSKLVSSEGPLVCPLVRSIDLPIYPKSSSILTNPRL